MCNNSTDLINKIGHLEKYRMGKQLVLYGFISNLKIITNDRQNDNNNCLLYVTEKMFLTKRLSTPSMHQQD